MLYRKRLAKNGVLLMLEQKAWVLMMENINLVSDLEVKIDPLKEWPQTLDEAWRINRDYFYDPGMHGADWAAMKEKYDAFLPELASRRT